MHTINPSIFRAYDVRGTYPDKINSKAVFAIARGFMRLLKEEAGKDNLTICIGQDVRPSSPELFDAFAKGVAHEGDTIIDIGVAMTPAFYFAVSHYGYDGGVIITASHNPNPYNGLKMVRAGGLPIGSEEGLKTILEYAQDINGDYANAPIPSITKKDIFADYIREMIYLAEVPEGSLADMRVAIDVGNGVAGAYVDALLQKFPGLSCTHLYFEADGNFPNHGPDPTIKENLADIRAVMEREYHTCGVVFDGDADRIVFIDERAREVDGGLLLALLARVLLRKHPGARILYTASATRAVADTVAEYGGTSGMTRIGNAFIKPHMQREGALFAGEFSGHYTIGEGRFYEVPFVVLLMVLQEIQRTGKALGELIEEVRGGWYHSGEINMPVENEKKEALLAKIEEAFSDGKINKLDGVRVDYDDWWFILRPSNTEPLMRLSVEADSEEKMQEKVEEIKKLIM